MNIPFSKPCFNKEDINWISSRLQRILTSGWLTSGPYVEELERMFAEFVGSSYSVALNSCTAALHATLYALGIGEGDEVIVPTNTFVATANAVLYVGAKPVFADSCPDTFNISPEDVQNKITNKTKAIIAVHLGGNPCDMKELIEIAEDYHVYIIEDAAHAHGSKYQGINCGTLGVAGAFSFYPTKIMTTGEGGMVVTDDKTLAEKIKVLRNHGRSSYGPAEVVELGFNYRMSDINAIIGLCQLRRINEFLRKRNEIASLYNEELKKIKWMKPQLVKQSNVSSYYAYIVKLTEDAPIGRDELIKKLNESGIATSIMYKPVHQQPYYKKLLGSKQVRLPVAEDLGKTSFALPIYNCMSRDEALYVIHTLKEIAEACEK